MVKSRSTSKKHELKTFENNLKNLEDTYRQKKQEKLEEELAKATKRAQKTFEQFVGQAPPMDISPYIISQYSGLASAPSGTRFGSATMMPMLPPQEDQTTLRSRTIDIKDTTIEDAKKILFSVLNTEIVPYLWGPPGVGKCLDGDSIIATPDGNTRIKDIKLDDKIYGIDKNGLKAEGKVTHLFKQISKKLLKITIANQQIICSPEHRFLLTTGMWQPAFALDKDENSVVLYTGEIQPHQKMDTDGRRQVYSLMAKGKNMARNLASIKSVNKIHTTEKMANENAQKYFYGRNISQSRTEINNLEQRTNNSGFGLSSGNHRWRGNHSLQHVVGRRRCFCTQARSLYNQHIGNTLQLSSINTGGIQDTRPKKIQYGVVLPIPNARFTSKKIIRANSTLSHYQKTQGTDDDRILPNEITKHNWNTIPRGRITNSPQSKKREFRGGQISKIDNIFTGENGQQTYDIETTLGNYIANGFVVHNSELLKQICKEKGWDLIDLRLSLLNPIDLRGLPVVNRKKKVAEWYPPAFLPNKEHKNKGILFLDELNLAPLATQAAAYQLILDKQVGEYKFPSHWMIVAAGNREVDRAQVYKLPAPLANRFIHINIIPDFYTWKEWATKNEIHGAIINFLTIKPTLLFRMPSDSEKAFSSPRSWAFLSNILKAFDYKKGQPISSSLKQTIIGTVGEAIGKEFIVFIEKIDTKKIAQQVEKFIKTGRIKLPIKHLSIRYAIITAIVESYLAKKISKARYGNFIKKLSKEEKEVIKSPKSGQLWKQEY